MTADHESRDLEGAAHHAREHALGADRDRPTLAEAREDALELAPAPTVRIDGWTYPARHIEELAGAIYRGIPDEYAGGAELIGLTRRALERQAPDDEALAP